MQDEEWKASGDSVGIGDAAAEVAPFPPHCPIQLVASLGRIRSLATAKRRFAVLLMRQLTCRRQDRRDGPVTRDDIALLAAGFDGPEV
jgi:hypothetical protein